MYRHARVLGLIAGLAITCGATSESFAQTKPITLRISAFTTSNSPNHRNTIDRFIKEIEADSKGRVKFETYFGGTAYGKPRAQFEQVQRGLVDISHGIFGYTPGRFPMVDMLGLPFVYNDSVVASKAFWLTYEKFLKDRFPDVHPISIWLTSMQQIHLRKPIDSLGALKGLKLRAAGSTMIDALAKLGAEGVVTPAPAVYERLEKGVLDGAVGSWGMLVAFNVGEVTSYHLEANIVAAPLFLLMNKAKYEALPPDIKKLIDRYSTVEKVGEFAQAFVNGDKRGLALAKSKGHTFRALTDKERAEWSEKTKPVIEAYLTKLESKGLPARKVFDYFKAELKKQ